MNDKTIIDLYFERSEKAIQLTEAKYGRYCYSIANGILKNSEDSKECINDAYLRMWNSIPPKRPENLRTYLGKIVRNLSLNRYERQTAVKRGADEISLLLSEAEEFIPSQGKEANISDDLVIRDAINSFLKGLSVKKRVIFVKRYWYAKPIKEIASECKVSEAYTKVTLYRLREKLRLQLEKEGIGI
ncbi:MAG: RNA polymerase sigma factor [Clostridia bacterium]|nr:RNA polymerase sigma factor [Clostridia bacterium]